MLSRLRAVLSARGKMALILAPSSGLNFRVRENSDKQSRHGRKNGGRSGNPFRMKYGLCVNLLQTVTSPALRHPCPGLLPQHKYYSSGNGDFVLRFQDYSGMPGQQSLIIPRLVMGLQRTTEGKEGLGQNHPPRNALEKKLFIFLLFPNNVLLEDSLFPLGFLQNLVDITK